MVSPVIGPRPVRSVLRQRGFEIEATGDIDQLLFPFESSTRIDNNYLLKAPTVFGRKSFRKVSRHITSHPDRVAVSDLEKISGDETAEYLDLLQNLQVIEVSNRRVRLLRSVDNIGPTLEWYVARICQAQFGGSAEWSVKLSDLQHGDFDVVAWLPPTLLYVETKSSRPEEIEDTELRHFLQRGIDLSPELAVLLIDTEDDLEQSGVIHRLFELMLPTVALATGITDLEWRNDERPFIEPQREFSGISFGYFRYYVTNTEPSIETQLRKCLRHYNAKVKGATLLGGHPVNFVTGKLE